MTEERDRLVRAVLEREDETAGEPFVSDDPFRLLVAAVVGESGGDRAAVDDAVHSVTQRWRSATELAAADPADVAKTLGASVEGGENTAVDDSASSLAGPLHGLAEAVARSEPGESLLDELPDLSRPAAEAFLRNVQVLWPEVYPYAGRTALRAAGELGVAEDAEELAQLVDGPEEVSRLADALAHVARDEAYDDVRARAGS